MLEIITTNNLTNDNKKMLNEFNELYTKWSDSHVNDYPYIEMQAKLLTLQQFIINGIKKNNGLLQICKTDPEIKLHYIANENNNIIVIKREEYEARTTTVEGEIMELREMIMNCVSLYSSFFEEPSFEELGDLYLRTMENVNKLEEQQRLIYEHKDIECIFD